MAFDDLELSPCYETMSLQIGLIGRDRFLIPFEANAKHIGNVKQSVTNFIWLVEDRIGPILPFQSMRGLGDAHHVSGHFRVKMCGHRYARRSRNGRCARFPCVHSRP
jgi:hypothetical protein